MSSPSLLQRTIAGAAFVALAVAKFAVNINLQNNSFLTDRANEVITKVFTSDEVKECTRIRTPYLEISGDDHYHLWAICCGDNACGHKVYSGRGLDDHKDARVIMKTSTD